MVYLAFCLQPKCVKQDEGVGIKGLNTVKEQLFSRDIGRIHFCHPKLQLFPNKPCVTPDLKARLIKKKRVFIFREE